MTEDTLIILIFYGLLFSISFHAIVAAVLKNNDCDIFYTPKTIYEESNMNWFGCIIVYIIMFPFGFVFAIGGFLRWLFTVGRK